VHVRGECHFQCGGSPYIARAGDLVLIPPFKVHTAGIGIGSAYRAVYVGAALLDQFQMIFQSGPGDHRCGDVVVPSSPLAPGLLDAIERQDVGSILSIVGSIIERHVWSTRPAFPPATRAHPLLGMMHEAVERHLSIGDIAASLQMSAESLSRTFHRTFGMPAVFYRNQLRLQAAEDLLSFGMPAAEVAAHCGYADQSHFVRELKKARGVTPSRYVDSYRLLT
jgi:AraC-like DNA-binding protein